MFVNKQEETIEDYVENGIDPLVVSLYQMDLDRAQFLLRSYLRVRLLKVFFFSKTFILVLRVYQRWFQVSMLLNWLCFYVISNGVLLIVADREVYVPQPQLRRSWKATFWARESVCYQVCFLTCL